MVFILTYRPAGPTAPRTARFPLESTWIGWDGTRWDLRNGTAGVMLAAGGVVGMHNPKYERFTSESRAVPGSRRRGSRALARSVVWPLLVHSESSEEWLAANAGFWGSIHPDLEGTWEVRAAGQTRRLHLTGRFDDEHSYELDPSLVGWAGYVVQLEAAQPFWEGDTITREYTLGATESFIPEGGAPPFIISRGATFATASITNPGDIDAYPVWTAVGPLEAITVGVGSSVIDVPFDLTTGQVLRIDTDPRNQTATLDGEDATEDLGIQMFAPIAPGQSQQLQVAATGAGLVRVDLTPLFNRAF